MSQFKRLFIVSTIFELMWFLAVVGRDTWQWLTIVLVVIIVLGTAYREHFDWRAWLLLSVIGVCIDSINLKIGLLAFDTAFLPLWLIALWAVFCWYALFLGKALSHYPLWIVSIVGGLAGALSYIAGLKLGAVSLGFSLPVAFVLFFSQWVAFVFLCMKIVNVGAKHNEDNKDKLA
ncbi:hypothetical protein JCM19238_1938 [Vibrio ponticus]|nr:hypothetical protein JCM19238_1938 [Vibrio ponticus]